MVQTTTANHAQPQKAQEKPQSEKGSKVGQSSSRSNASSQQQQGFQWEGPSIFNEVDTHAPAHEVNVAPDVVDNNEEEYGSVLAVPMLPGVSLEPIYRQQRSFSFSMGQDPEYFGYNDYEDDDDNNSMRQFKRSLETMAEEDETLLADDDVYLSRFRTRSKSSGAALAMLSTSQQSSLLHQFMRCGSDQDQGTLNSDTEKKSSPPARDPVQQLAERMQSMEMNAPPYQPGSYATPIPVTFPMHPHQEIYAPHHPPPPHPSPTTAPSHPHAHPQGAAAAPPPSGFHPPPHPPPYLHRHPQSSPSPEQALEPDSRAYHDMGKGVSLHKLPEGTPLYLVEFKAKRTDFFYLESHHGSKPKVNDLVIVEADRGKDLGRVTMENLSVDHLVILYTEKQKEQQHADEHSSSPRGDHAEISKSDIHIKRIYRLALPEEIGLLSHKKEDEQRALAVCQQKTRQRKLPMEVVDAEFQWDRRKLTFYFMAERRIDFRELVRELFKTYKTRIWMCAVNTSKSP